MPKSITELRKHLCEVFDELRAGSMTGPEAKEINNAAGKIIGSLKVQLEYAALRKEKPSLSFLEDSTKKQKARR